MGIDFKANKIPLATLLIAAITFLYSIYIAVDVNGKVFSNLQLLQLDRYGALSIEHLRNLEFWRLFTFQLMHVKYMHMIYNVISIIVLGIFVEPSIRAFRFFLLWLITGSVGTLVGIVFIAPPWDLGTGASQAVLGVAGFGLVLSIKGITSSKWFWLVLGFSFIPAFALDFIHAGYPKLAHILSLCIGLIAGFIYVKPVKNNG